MAKKKEARARIKINNLLQAAGWRFFDDNNGRANIQLEPHIKITQKQLNELGEDFEKKKSGFVDFLLLDEKDFPHIVLEAKSEDRSPFNGKEQARQYAQSLSVRYVILSNGNEHYFWDLQQGNPTQIDRFPTPDSLIQVYKPDPEKLVNEAIESDYIVVTQMPNYKTDPRWIDEGQRDDFIRENGLRFLRPYQIRAVNAIQEAIRKGNDRFLFEMATGTGKTLIAGAIIKLFLTTANARRVLFLVDRLELEDQAWKNLSKYLKDYAKVSIYKENIDSWNKAEVIVSTVQSLLFNSKYRREFVPSDFDFIISDEAHRSIGGNSRAVFEYFIGYKLGLTATPKDYLKNINKYDLNENDPRALERRMLLDTYETFGCKSGEPTFRYSLVDGAKDGYLVNPRVIDARTEITTQLLSDEGYAVIVINEDGKEEEVTYNQRDYEKKFFSEETNKIFCATFIANALRDPISNEIGKTIVFCVSQDHASRITQLLNIYADQVFPGKYNSDFAVQITSYITGAQDYTRQFADNKLNGFSRYLEDYKTSKTRVCVTVGMMTTGYDCEDILNLCLMRPIFSPTDFIQIKGRGTRTFKFTFTHKDKFGHTKVVQIDKKNFKLFDFFANYEYFEEKYNYDEVLELPRIQTGGNGEGGGTIVEDYTSKILDPIKTVKETEIGYTGMKVDRMFFNFEAIVKNDQYARENYANGNIDDVVQYVKDKYFGEEFDLNKLQKSIEVDRPVGLVEILDKIFGKITSFKSYNELLDEEFEKFATDNKPLDKDRLALKNVMKEYVENEEFRKLVDSGNFSSIAYMSIYQEFISVPIELRKAMQAYVKKNVSLNTYIN